MATTSKTVKSNKNKKASSGNNIKSKVKTSKANIKDKADKTSKTNKTSMPSTKDVAKMFLHTSVKDEKHVVENTETPWYEDNKDNQLSQGRETRTIDKPMNLGIVPPQVQKQSKQNEPNLKESTNVPIKSTITPEGKISFSAVLSNLRNFKTATNVNIPHFKTR